MILNLVSQLIICTILSFMSMTSQHDTRFMKFNSTIYSSRLTSDITLRISLVIHTQTGIGMIQVSTGFDKTSDENADK